MAVHKESIKIRRPFRDDPKLAKRLKRPLWLVAVVLSILILAQGLYTQKQQQNADLRYGIWDGAVYEVTEQNLEQLENLPIIESFAFQNIEGIVTERIGDQEKNWGTIGWADPAFYDLANLQLKTGRLPKTKDEIAVEASVLDDMGISYDPGQAISLNIMDQDGNAEKRSFILTGVLENYTSYWNGQGSLLHFYTGSVDPTAQRNVFFTVQPGYQKAVRKIMLEKNAVETNENRQLATDPFSYSNSLASMTVTLLILFCGLLLLQILFDWTFYHRKEIELLRTLGCRTSILLKNLSFLLLGCMTGPILTIGVALILSGLPASWMLLIILLFGSLVVLDLIFFFAFVLLQTKLPENKKKKKKRMSRKKHKSKDITTKEAASRLSRHLKTLFWMKLGLSVLCLIVSIVSVNNISENLGYLSDESGMDFLITGTNNQTFRFCDEETEDCFLNYAPDDIPEDVLEKIANNTDLKVAFQGRRFRGNLRWENIDQALFADPQTGKPDSYYLILVNLDENGEPALFMDIQQTSYEPEVSRIREAVTEGDVDWDKWAKGQEAIVSLPPMLIEQMRAGPVWNGTIDTSLKIGDFLSIKDENYAETILPVTGIIRSTEGWPSYGVYLGSDRVNTMYLNLASKTNRIPVELFLSRLASENSLQFFNQAQSRENARHDLQMRIILQSALLLFVVTLYIFALLFIRQLKKDRQQQYLFKLEKTGLPIQVVQAIGNTSHHDQVWTTIAVLLFAGAMITCWIITTQYLPSFPWQQIGMGLATTIAVILLTVYF